AFAPGTRSINPATPQTTTDTNTRRMQPPRSPALRADPNLQASCAQATSRGPLQIDDASFAPRRLCAGRSPEHGPRGGQPTSSVDPCARGARALTVVPLAISRQQKHSAVPVAPFA